MPGTLPATSSDAFEPSLFFFELSGILFTFDADVWRAISARPNSHARLQDAQQTAREKRRFARGQGMATRPLFSSN